MTVCARRLLGILLIVWAALQSTDVTRAQDDRSTLQVLFIGNSYTYVNNVGDIVAGIAEALRGGPRIEPTLAVRGGMPLGWHLANGPAMTLLEARNWDHVVLQEHSLLGGYVIDGEPRMAPAELFHRSARTLVARVRARGSAPLLFMTWARRDRPAEEPILTNAYLEIGRELDVPVAPAGTAWHQALRERIDADLYADDGAHPSPAGSYLVACVLYAALTGRSPQGAPALIEGAPYSRIEGDIDRTQQVRLVELDPAVAARLQEIAWRTVADRGPRGSGRGP